MFGLKNHSYSSRRQLLREVAGHLLSEALLHLKVAREQLNDSGELGEPNEAIPWHITDMRDATKRQQVVFAQRMERDVPNEHKFFVVFVIRERCHGEIVRGEHFEQARCDSAWGIGEVFTCDVTPESRE